MYIYSNEVHGLLPLFLFAYFKRSKRPLLTKSFEDRPLRPGTHQNLDSMSFLVASTTSADEYCPPDCFMTKPMTLLAALSFF